MLKGYKIPKLSSQTCYHTLCFCKKNSGCFWLKLLLFLGIVYYAKLQSYCLKNMRMYTKLIYVPLSKWKYSPLCQQDFSKDFPKLAFLCLNCVRIRMTKQ